MRDFIYGKPPAEQLQEWQRTIKKEQRQLDKEIRDVCLSPLLWLCVCAVPDELVVVLSALLLAPADDSTVHSDLGRPAKDPYRAQAARKAQRRQVGPDPREGGRQVQQAGRPPARLQGETQLGRHATHPPGRCVLSSLAVLCPALALIWRRILCFQPCLK